MSMVSPAEIFLLFFTFEPFTKTLPSSICFVPARGLEKARGPQPFVQAHGRIVMIVFHSLFEMIELN